MVYDEQHRGKIPRQRKAASGREKKNSPYIVEQRCMNPVHLLLDISNVMSSEYRKEIEHAFYFPFHDLLKHL
jgi:hypothetical protein